MFNFSKFFLEKWIFKHNHVDIFEKSIHLVKTLIKLKIFNFVIIGGGVPRPDHCEERVIAFTWPGLSSSENSYRRNFVYL